jgi:hypothetical protein
MVLQRVYGLGIPSYVMDIPLLYGHDKAPQRAGCVRVLHGQPLARADTQIRPSIGPIARLVGGQRCVPPKGLGDVSRRMR